MHSNLERRSSRPNRVLIVDDSDDAAWALASLLQSCGHEVHVAHTGPRAIDLAERVHPAVIFLDLTMPEMDGFETALRIRRRRWGRDIVLCALTAFDTPEFRERSGEVGINRYLAKPAQWAELLAVAGAVCENTYTATRMFSLANRVAGGTMSVGQFQEV
jgi:two-component system OmpR family response regulator